MHNSFVSHPVTDSVNELFYRPLHEVFPALENRYPCPELNDELWLRIGIERVLHALPSGRAFLQEHALRFEQLPKVSNYFESLKSARRADLAEEAAQMVCALAEACLPDRLANIPELARYEVFALDGHWLRGASHDPREAAGKEATGHFYSLNLRHHTLRHLSVSEYAHENDMHALKRLQPKRLRHGTPKGRRTLIIYDRAGIDFDFWGRCRKECGIYFVSRVKQGMSLEYLCEAEWDRADPRNEGVIQDRRVHTTKSQLLRVVHYQEPVTGQEFEFLTNESDLPPGVIAELYHRRWDIEKVFDELKNKLGQRQSWSSHPEGKRAQGQLVALTHNLLCLTAVQLESDHGLRHEAEDRRSARRAEQAEESAAEHGRTVSKLLKMTREATVHSVKFIRWLRGCLQSGATVADAVPILARSYARL
jgi:hypothetical protein